MKVELTKILNDIHAVQVTGNPAGKEITGITINSRLAEAGSLFVAIKGYKTDGHKFVLDAINKGACAVIVEKSNNLPEQIFDHQNCVKIVVDNSRQALAEVSNSYWDFPSQKLKLIGITGTKGKTTTAYYIKNILEQAGYKCGLIGTIANYIGSEKIDTKLTTPENHTLNELISRMLNAGCTHCVMEVSSHSLELFRVAGLDFDVALFTNLSSDHMDFHSTTEKYFEAKKILFDTIKPDAYALVNSDDAYSEKIVSGCKADKLSFGITGNPDYKIKNISFNLEGTHFNIECEASETELSTRLIGKFNAYNAASAFAAGNLLGIKKNFLIGGIKSTPQIPGRFEVLAKGNKKVIVDYSHTAGSLKEALEAIAELVKHNKQVVTVFGCGGDRDRSKRPVMAEIASTMSSKVYITSDNPRTEDPYKIIEEILPGIKGNNFVVIENREEAIAGAIKDSENDAVVLIAGKGHENYQEINGVRKYFSDKETALKYLEQCKN